MSCTYIFRHIFTLQLKIKITEIIKKKTLFQNAKSKSFFKSKDLKSCSTLFTKTVIFENCLIYK